MLDFNYLYVHLHVGKWQLIQIYHYVSPNKFITTIVNEVINHAFFWRLVILKTFEYLWQRINELLSGKKHYFTQYKTCGKNVTLRPFRNGRNPASYNTKQEIQNFIRITIVIVELTQLKPLLLIFWNRNKVWINNHNRRFMWDVITHPCLPSTAVNTLRPRRNVQHFADDILKRIFLNENVWISINISLNFVS